MYEEDFAALNESAQLELCPSSSNRTAGDIGGISGYANIGTEQGTYIFVLRFVSSEASSENATLRANIELTQQVAY